MRAEDLRKRIWPVQLALLVKEVPKRAADYLYELKFDGYRIVAVKAGGELRLFSRREQDWTSEFEVIAAAARKLSTKEFVIDGEVCALDERGVPRFQLLQNRRGHDTRLAYFVFDLLWVDGSDLRHAPLEDRRERLARLLGRLPKDSRIALSSAVPGDPKEILRTACKSGLEGIVAKVKTSSYVGGRQPTWLKIKCALRQEFALAGYIPLLGTHVGEVGALMLALKGKDGVFHYAGKVGTGFTSEARRTLGKRIEADLLMLTHPRSYDRGQRIEDPSHLEALATEKKRASELRGRDRLRASCPNAEPFLQALAQRNNRLSTQTALLLTLLDRYGARDLDAALADALARGAVAAQSVAHILDQLSRRRRQKPPLPPQALTDPRAAIIVKPHELGPYDKLGRRRGGDHE